MGSINGLKPDIRLPVGPNPVINLLLAYTVYTSKPNSFIHRNIVFYYRQRQMLTQIISITRLEPDIRFFFGQTCNIHLIETSPLM